MSWYFSGGYAFVPRNIMCSKKWANPDLPGSTSFREPVWTGIWTETRFGNPVGTTMTFNPFGSVFSTALNGRRSREAAGAAGFFAGVAAFVCWAVARVARGVMRARRIAARARKRVMQASPSIRGIPFNTWSDPAMFHAGAYREDGSGLWMDRLDDALEILDGAGPDYAGGLANHGPMAAEALFTLDRPDAVVPWTERYRRKLGDEPAADRWVFELAPGFAVAAAHGVIRVGHGVRSLARLDVPGRRKELARGFAYWAATHQ